MRRLLAGSAIGFFAACSSGAPLDPGADEGRPNASASEATAGESDAAGFVKLDADPSYVACDIWSPNCPAGQKCAPYSSDGSLTLDDFACVDVLGDLEHGEACTILGDTITSGLDTCERGAWCFAPDPTVFEGTCLQHCTGSQLYPYCPLASECLLSALGTPAVCVQDCHPFDRPCSHPNFHCVPFEDGGWACGHDLESAAKLHGEPCTFANACQRGHVCAPLAVVPNGGCTQGDSCCTKLCTVGAANDCPNADLGEVCVPYYTHITPPVGYEDVGYCALPP